MGLRGSVTTVTLVANDQEVIGPNEKRYTLIFLPPSNQVGNISVNNRITTGDGDGFNVSKGQGPTILCADQLGDLVKGPWHVWASHAGDLLTIIEGVEI